MINTLWLLLMYKYWALKKGKENRWGWCKNQNVNQLGKVLHRANKYWSQFVLSVCIKQPVLGWLRFTFLNKYFLNVKCAEFSKE